jgi:hypothetical protein
MRSSMAMAFRLALSPGEAHDNRLAGKLLSRLRSGSMLLAAVVSALDRKGEREPNYVSAQCADEDLLPDVLLPDRALPVR